VIVLVLVTGLVFALIVLVIRPTQQRGKLLSLSAALAATAIKLWLVSWQDLIGNGAAGHDDFLFLWLAGFVSAGDWLGVYNEFTLIKGPFLSVWISWLHKIGLPFLLTNQLLYVFACVVAAIALRPVITSSWGVLIVYLVALFNPMSFSLAHIARVDRFAIYSSLILLLHACIVGWLLRCHRAKNADVIWLFGASLILGIALITREASIWLFPGVALVLAATMLFSRWNVRSAKRYLLCTVFLVVIAAIPTQLVSYMNWKHYEFWGVTEFGDSEFANAYGALTRVEPRSPHMAVPISKQARMNAYKVSSSLATLEELLEGELGQGWARVSSQELMQSLDGEIAGGWFMWAFRDAATRQGMHQWFGKSETFYKQIADEINFACQQGPLECLAPRSGFTPVFDAGQLLPALNVFFKAWASMATFSQYRPESDESVGQDWMLDMFQDFTWERLSSNWQDGPTTERYVDKQRAAERRLEKIQSRYRKWAPALAILLSLLFIYRLVLWVRLSTDEKRLLTAALAILANMGAYAAMLSYIEVTSFLTINHQYLFPNHALLCWLIGGGVALVGVRLGPKGVARIKSRVIKQSDKFCFRRPRQS
jgi:hypothetical protein